MATLSRMVPLLAVAAIVVISMSQSSVEATWCVARSDASNGALQAGLNYACSHGADCRPIQPGGSCFIPNVLRNHASYAYDSYYQRNGKNPAACNFGGTATIAVTDPSFGRCIYPPFTRSSADATTTSLPMENQNVMSSQDQSNKKD